MITYEAGLAGSRQRTGRSRTRLAHFDSRVRGLYPKECLIGSTEHQNRLQDRRCVLWLQQRVGQGKERKPPVALSWAITQYGSGARSGC